MIPLIITWCLIVNGAFGTIYITQNYTLNVVATFEDVVIPFGPQVFNIDGYMFIAFPKNGCSELTPAISSITNDVSMGMPVDTGYRWPGIVLIEPGGCDLDVKVYNAQRANYSAAIVSSPATRVSVVRGRRSDWGEIHIPSVVVDNRTGRELIFYSVPYARQMYMVSIVSFYSLPLKYVLLSLFAVVAASLVILIICFAVHVCNTWCRLRRNRLPRRHLRKLPIKVFVKGEDPYDVCSICLEDYEDQDRLRLLPCHHAFHTKCVDPWLLCGESRCPICNQFVELTTSPVTTRAGQASSTTTARVRFSDRLVRLLRGSRLPSRRGHLETAVVPDSDDDHAPLLSHEASASGVNANCSPAAVRQQVGTTVCNEDDALISPTADVYATRADLVTSSGHSGTAYLQVTHEKTVEETCEVKASSVGPDDSALLLSQRQQKEKANSQ